MKYHKISQAASLSFYCYIRIVDGVWEKMDEPSTDPLRDRSGAVVHARKTFLSYGQLMAYYDIPESYNIRNLKDRKKLVHYYIKQTGRLYMNKFMSMHDPNHIESRASM